MILFKRYAPGFMDMEDGYYRTRMFESMDEVYKHLDVNRKHWKDYEFCLSKTGKDGRYHLMISGHYDTGEPAWWVLGTIEASLKKIKLPFWDSKKMSKERKEFEKKKELILRT